MTSPVSSLNSLLTFKPSLVCYMTYCVEHFNTAGNKRSNNSTTIANLTSNQDSAAPRAPKYAGVTSPISLDLPTEEDLLLNGELLSALRTFDIFEDETELQHRETVLEKLDTLFKEWIKEVCQEKGLPPFFIETVGGEIFPFGPYRLGVHAKGADIDALCIAPEDVEREDFFASFYERLKQQEEAKDVQAAQDAFVPIISLVFDGVEIDLLFARVALKRIPSNLKLLSAKLTKNIDQRCVRSLNGCRVTEEILSLVPNVDTFRLALMAIKLWAKRRDISSNALGFLGGVSWAILLARICQLYPNATAATLVCKFFKVYNMWTSAFPILLMQAVDLQFGYPVWDPRVNFADWSHLMPTITPSYPHQSSSFNVTASTRAIIVEEIKRGLEITEGIQQGKADWFKLFEAPDFFQKYKHYIVLLASALTEKQGPNWFRLVESQIRHFVGSLEHHGSFSLAHLHPKSFPGPKGAFDKETTSAMWLIGVLFKRAKGSEILNVDVTLELEAFADYMYIKASRSNMWEDGLMVSAKYMRRNNLHHLLSHLMHISNTSKAPTLGVPHRTDGSFRARPAPAKKRKCCDESEMPLPPAKKMRATDVNQEASRAPPPSRAPHDSRGSAPGTGRSRSPEVGTMAKTCKVDDQPTKMEDKTEEAELSLPGDLCSDLPLTMTVTNVVRFKLKRK